MSPHWPLPKLHQHLSQPSMLEDAGFLPSPAEKLRQAAVLVLMHPGPADTELLLTRRSAFLPTHAGQISFPGGSIDAEDASVAHTALREAHEETGLPPAAVEVIGALPGLQLPSGFAVTPVIGLCDCLPELSPNPGEVDEIFSIPLDFLLQEGLFQHGTRIRNNIKREFYYFEFKEYYIWGATAAMLRSLARRLTG